VDPRPWSGSVLEDCARGTPVGPIDCTRDRSRFDAPGSPSLELTGGRHLRQQPENPMLARVPARRHKRRAPCSDDAIGPATRWRRDAGKCWRSDHGSRSRHCCDSACICPQEVMRRRAIGAPRGVLKQLSAARTAAGVATTMDERRPVHDCSAADYEYLRALRPPARGRLNRFYGALSSKQGTMR
jgi:hypothetical protein